MGIQGLMTFMECNDCCEQVRLSDIADAYRNKIGKDPLLLVDLSSVIACFYNSSPSIKTVSGELKKFKENFKTFLNNCKELGIEVKIFGDGKKPFHKYRIWMNSFAQKVDDLKRIYSGQTNTFSTSPWRGVLFWLINDYLLLKNNCKFSRAIYEADSDIIKFLKTDDCFAIWTNDTDFIMVDNVPYCLTSDALSVKSMTFFNFNRNKLAKLLKINTSQLPLFASLCLSHFQCSDLMNLYKQKNINTKERFFEVAKLIKNLTSKEELLQYISSLKEPMEMSGLETRLKFYFGEEQEDVRQTLQNHWDEILNFAEERHTTGEAHASILSIIQDKVTFNAPTSENIFMSSAGEALLTIRKKIYGILFFEHPNSLIFVTEFSCGSLKSPDSTSKPNLRTVIVDRRPHPGLLKLWSLQNSNTLKTSRQTVFCEAINNKLTAINFSSLNIPVEYVFPILAAFYFLWECDRKKFKEFEVEIILIQAVLVNRLTGKQIDQLPGVFHVEALDLSGWFFAILDCLWLLNSACGYPFCRHKTNLINFFDGKVMHYIYGKVKERESPWTSFNEFKKEYETLISVLYELGRICGHVESKEKRGSLLNGDTAD